MKKEISIALCSMTVIAGTILAGWVMAGNSFMMYKVFAPATEQVRRDTFKQSQAYNQSMKQEIENMQFDYMTADNEHKDAMKSIILHRVADYNVDLLEPDTKQFILNLRSGKQ